MAGSRLGSPRAGKRTNVKEDVVAISEITKRRLEMQGYNPSDDPELAGALPWSRFAYAGCALLIGLGTILASPAFLWAAMTLALSGVLLRYHLFDLLYNHPIRRLSGTAPLPRQGAPRRFACGLAVPWLAVMIWAYEIGLAPLGYVLGGSLVAVASLVITTYICIPSIIYGFVFGGRAVRGVSIS